MGIVNFTRQRVMMDHTPVTVRMQGGFKHFIPEFYVGCTGLAKCFSSSPRLQFTEVLPDMVRLGTVSPVRGITSHPTFPNWNSPVFFHGKEFSWPMSFAILTSPYCLIKIKYFKALLSVPECVLAHLQSHKTEFRSVFT